VIGAIFRLVLQKMFTWSIEEINNYYAEYAKEYDDDIHPDTYPAPFLISTWVVEELLDLLASRDKLKILDIGVGTGQSSKLFFSHQKSRQFDVFGVDATPEVK
jgi:SAM-dependent methyltransferase